MEKPLTENEKLLIEYYEKVYAPHFEAIPAWRYHKWLVKSDASNFDCSLQFKSCYLERHDPTKAAE